jgi:hypothetical protein
VEELTGGRTGVRNDGKRSRGLAEHQAPFQRLQ